MEPDATVVGILRVAQAVYRANIIKRFLAISEEGEETDNRFIALPGFRIPFLDRRIDLWDDRASKEFQKFYTGGNLCTELDKRLYNRAEPFIIKVPQDYSATIPWEAFQRCLDKTNRSKFAPLRMIEHDAPWAFGTVAGKLSVIAMIGHPGPGQEFIPSRARDLLTSIFENLDASAKSRLASMTPLSTIILSEQGLGAAANVAKRIIPNVVIYFGHGRFNTGPELRCGPGPDGWVPLAQIVDSVFPAKTGRPPFWVFWACSLAEDSTQPKLQLDGPEIFQAMAARGAVSILAMRSKIRVAFARVMLQALLQALAAGETLEVAAALARAAACATESGKKSGGQMDFAAPAVWSISEPVPRINWGEEDSSFPLAWVSLPLLAGDEGEFDDIGTGAMPISDWAMERASSWSQQRNIFVSISSQKGLTDRQSTARARFFEVGAAVRHLTGRAVVPIILRAGADFDRKLQYWARAAHTRLDPRHHDREFALAIKAVSESGSYGFQRLIAIPDLFIMLSEPPDRDATWDLFSNPAHGVSLLITGPSIPDPAQNWTVDQLSEVTMPTPSPGTDPISDSLVNAPIAVTMLALLDRPVSLNDVAEVARVDRLQLSPIEPLTISIGSRRLLGEVARRQILERAPVDTIATARRCCVSFLSSLVHDFDALLEIVRHLIALGESERAARLINAAYDEFGARWTVPQWRQLAEIAGEAPTVLRKLGDGTFLAISQACVLVQDIGFGRAVLETRSPRSLADRARRHSLLSEVYKADVQTKLGKTLMRSNAEDAIKLASEALRLEPRNRSLIKAVADYRHNLARIQQYFDGEYDAAFAIYSEILSQTRPEALDDREIGHLYAAACRNAAECLFDPASKPLSSDIYERAEDLVLKGLESAAHHSWDELRAELTYTRARLAEANADRLTSKQHLDRVLTIAANDRFPIIATIARDRLYWLRVQAGDLTFTFEDVLPSMRALDLLSWHGWSVRVAIKSRLRAAKRLADRGGTRNKGVALGLLEHNRQVVRSDKGLEGRSDRLRAAITYAGLQLLSEPQQESPWQEFKKIDWTTAWFVENNNPAAEGLWNRID